MGNLTDKLARVMGAFTPDLERSASALLAEVDAVESRLAEHESNAKTCDVCARRTPNVLVMCDDCDPTIDGKVAGTGSGVAKLQEEKETMESRLGYLNRWLESRGLPLTWDGPLDAWGWVVYDYDGNVIGYDHEESGRCPPGDTMLMERWDDAPASDRAEALRIEAERKSNAL